MKMMMVVIVAVLGIIPAAALADFPPEFMSAYRDARDALNRCQQATGIEAQLPPEAAAPDANPSYELGVIRNRLASCEDRSVRTSAIRETTLERSAAREQQEPAPPPPARETTPVPARRSEPPPSVPAPAPQPTVDLVPLLQRLDAMQTRMNEIASEQRSARVQPPQAVQPTPERAQAEQPSEAQTPEASATTPAPAETPTQREQADQPAPQTGYRRIRQLPGAPAPGSAPAGPFLMPHPEQSVMYEDFRPTGWAGAVGRAAAFRNAPYRYLETGDRREYCFMAIEIGSRPMQVVTGSGALQVAVVEEGGRYRTVPVLRPGATGYFIADRGGMQHYRFRCFTPTGRRMATLPESVGIAADGRPYELVTNEVLALYSEGRTDTVPHAMAIQGYHLNHAQ